MARLVECVPNFSEGRDLEKVEKIVDEFRNIEGVTLLDYSSDADHNRSVVTVIGEPEKVKESVINAIRVAADLIDMSTHEGAHPRMGATDVVPFTPVSDVTMEECIEWQKKLVQLLEKWEFLFIYTKMQLANLKEKILQM